MTVRKVSMSDLDDENTVYVEPAKTDLISLAISDIGRTYIAKDKDNLLYKLHLCYIDKNCSGTKQEFERCFIWIMLNNSVGYTLFKGYPPKDFSKTIKEAIADAKRKGCVVYQVNLSDFEKILGEK